jgi:hypothetical protein
MRTQGVIGAGAFPHIASSLGKPPFVVAVAFIHTRVAPTTATAAKRFGLALSTDNLRDAANLTTPLAMPGSFSDSHRGTPAVSIGNGYIDLFWTEEGRRTLKHRAARL